MLFCNAKEYLIKKHYQRDPTEPNTLGEKPHLREAAELDDADAQYSLGLKYAKGQGVTQDDAEAVKWFRKAAEQGYTTAQNNLGFMYQKGRGVTQDYAEAVKLYRKAAVQGFATAQSNLGHMYANGRGVNQDTISAYIWSDIAASQGDKTAMANRNNYANQMTAEDISKAKELARECVSKGFKDC